MVKEIIPHLQEKFYKYHMQEHDSISMYISSISALARKLNDLGESISEAIAYQDQGWITTQL
jgi:cell fate (sporulation/competence/biofilm development) regulator YlbF (YheA/YmcA/DUF963 family)